MNPIDPFTGNTHPLSYGQFQALMNGPVPLSSPNFPLSMAPTPVDSFQSQKTKPPEQKKLPWYATFGKEVIINGLTIAASIAGGMVGGVVGAMAAGSATSATLGILDQKMLKKQKLDWSSVAIDGALGLIPGSVAEGLAKSGSKVLNRYTGKTVSIGAKNSVKRGVIVGATDGVVMGSIGGFAQSAHSSYQEDGKVNWTAAAKDSLKAMLSAVIGGGIGAGAVMRIRSTHSASSAGHDQPA